jgi:hypothetical protein
LLTIETPLQISTLYLNGSGGILKPWLSCRADHAASGPAISAIDLLAVCGLAMWLWPRKRQRERP